MAKMTKKQEQEKALEDAKRLARGGELKRAVALTKEHDLSPNEVAGENPDFMTSFRGK